MPTVICSRCSGTGQINVIVTKPCPRCFYGVYEGKTCTTCNGRSYIEEREHRVCPRCGGSGRLKY